MVKLLNLRRSRPSVVLLAVTALLVNLFAFAPVAGAADSEFASPLFNNVWQRTDFPIASQKVSRSWYWGPKPLGTGGFYEEYADSPGGKRLVQYFDKSRMELNDPGKPNVTNGLLVVEMITGKLQKGDNSFSDLGKANIPIAGDLNNPWPTFASLDKIYNKPLSLKVGDQAGSTWYPAGIGKQDPKYLTDATKIATIQNNIGIPAAFWNFLNRKGTVAIGNTYSEDTISDWLFSTGYPVTEAYWARVKVAGVDKEVMFQAFERRVLTYTPDNDPAYQVEMGNVGLQYINWRYKGVDNLPKGGATAPLPPGYPASTNPAAQPFIQATAEWYESDYDGLNIRTGPTRDAPRQVASETQPYVQALYKGDHVQAIAKVKGEEIEKGNDVWLQIYKDPDLFVYSGYVHKITPGDFPTPTKTFKGLWVAVSLQKQMMAVYEDNKLLYKTMIASGVPSDDPEKDHRTPKGQFSIIGSYRPATQTMEGGDADKAIGPGHYKIENIRNVSYFFEDYSIHGTYWHAKFGIQPMSHGCVNSTVYDAGLIYTLKAGTTVFVF
jgi:lipoprotein-anchoring transpeptidase ErfK/SrfK